MGITQLLNLIIQPINAIATAFIEILGTKSIREKIEKYLNIPEKKLIKEEIENISSFKSIAIKQVNYVTNSQDHILKNIDFIIEKGKKYAIVGPSGSGKSTLLNSISQLISPTSGEILVDGHLKNLRKNISYINQDPFLFKDSIINNITLYQNYSSEEINRALEFSDLSSRLNPKDLEELCLENGANFSGGEKQRIAIARAYLSNRPIMLLDEFTSAIDSELGQRIEKRILKLKNKTLIFVTHKLHKNFLLTMNEIFFMEQGKIIEKGKFKDLYRKNGRFYEHFLKFFVS
ncbi:MAG: ABC transporter ATP-binding protein/permease [Streptococcaceae bacterium]|nr:ABC transporter ATP-binding protein/permease [Streptococcaceae bacterium]